jgi:hypothetical protein
MPSKSLLFSIVILLITAFEHSASAACVGTPGNTPEMVGQPNDIIFAAGTPATAYIPHIYVNWHDTVTGGQDDCGVVAVVSNAPGVSVQQTYGCGGTCEIGTIVQARVALSYETPAKYYLPYDGPGGYAKGAVPVIYDGTLSNSINGRISFHVQDDFGNPGTLLGSVNVYVLTGNLPQTWFTWTSAPSNIEGDSLVVDRGLINSNSSAVVFAQHYSSNGTTWNHSIAVWYDTITGRWKIRNEDGTPMPSGLTFVVRVDPSAKRIPTAYSGQGSSLIIDDPRSNYNPFATIVVSPFSAGNRRMTHPYGLTFDGTHWFVSFMDGTAMPSSYVNSLTGAHYEPGFFVKIIGASQYVDDSLSVDASGMLDTYLSNGAGVDVRAIGSARVSGSTKFLKQFCWTTGSPMPLISTLNGYWGYVEAKRYGVGFSTNAATIFHEDGSLLYGDTTFNVWAPYRLGCPPDPMPHQ